MNVGASAYFREQSRIFGWCKVTFTCLDRKMFVSTDPVEQSYLQISIDADGVTVPDQYLRVSIIDQTERRLPGPHSDDWDTLHRVLMTVVGEDHGLCEGGHSGIDRCPWRKGTKLDAYVTEVASVTGAISTCLDRWHYIEPSWPECHHEGCEEPVASEDIDYCSLEHEAITQR